MATQNLFVVMNYKKIQITNHRLVDCKIFWEQTLASFFFWIFGLEFAEPGKSGESGKLPLKFVGFAKSARPPSELNSTAIS